jgi:hypothetical protein
MRDKNIAVTAEELNILKAKLKSLQTLKNICSKIAFPVTVAGMIFFIIYRLDGHMLIAIMLVGIYEFLALVDVSDKFKKEFKAMDEESAKDKSTEDISKEKIEKKGVSDV